MKTRMNLAILSLFVIPEGNLRSHLPLLVLLDNGIIH